MGADSSARPYSFDVNCDDISTFCRNGYYAHMSDTPSAMNLCSAWIDVKGSDSPQMQKTSDLLASCTTGKAQTLLHKWTHTKYFKDGGDKTLDYAYGVHEWLNLAAGSHKPKKRPNSKTPCADENHEPAVCDPNLVPDNADTLFIAADGIHLPSTTVKNDVIDDSDDDDNTSLTSISQLAPTAAPLSIFTATAVYRNSAASTPAIHASNTINGAM